MFCKNCGKEIPEGVNFCSACGSVISSTVQKSEENAQSVLSVNLDQSIRIKGKRAGEESFFYAALWLFLLLFAVGTWISWIIFAGLTVYAFMKIPRTVSYNSLQKKIITNEKSHFGPFRKSVEVSEIAMVRVRKVKLVFSFHHALSIPGEYFVVALDTRLQNMNLNIWFAKENEMREFLALLGAALKENGKNIPIDENLSVMKTKDFYGECKSEKESLPVGSFMKKHVWKGVATAVILFVIGCAALASGKGIDAGLNKLESAVTKMEKFEKKVSSGELSNGEIMEQYSKVMKDLDDATDMLKLYDKSDYTAKQWDRMYKLMERMNNLNSR